MCPFGCRRCFLRDRCGLRLRSQRPSERGRRSAANQSETMLRAALIGNPNVGKTLIFNSLAGGRNHVGNWPGVTVEKRVGRFGYGDREVELIDLPGVYSLTAFSLDQRIALQYILNERPEVVVDIVDASNLRRNLYLTLLLLELEVRLLVVLNKMDRARARGLQVNAERLSQLLGVSVVPTIAPREEGLEDLKQKIVQVAQAEDWQPPRLDYGPELEQEMAKLEESLPQAELARGYPRRWLVTKHLEGDAEIVSRLAEAPPSEAGERSGDG